MGVGQRRLAQVIGHPRRIDLLPRIEPTGGIEERLHLAHRAVYLVAEEPRVELAPHEPIAMLGAVHPPELLHERQHLLGDAAQRPHAPRAREVHEGADVETARRGVSVEAGAEVVAFEDGGEAFGVLRQPQRIDGGILHERQRALTPDPRCLQHPIAGLAQVLESAALFGALGA